MAFSGGIGVEADLASVPVRGALGDDAVLFSESASRLVVEVEPGRASAFESLMGNDTWARIGRCTADNRLVIMRERKRVLSLPLGRMKEAWQGTLIGL